MLSSPSKSNVSPVRAARDSASALSCPLCGSSAVAHLLSAADRFHGRSERFDLKRCSSCSCVWLPDPPTPPEMAFHYDEAYHKAITAAGETAAASRWQRHRNRIARHKQSGSILDIGCSSGAFLGTMPTDRWKRYGIEMESATARKARLHTGAEVFVGDVMDAPFASESFDVVTCFDLLEHVYEPRPFLDKVRQWLKPGGILYTVLPNIDSWEARLFGTCWYGLELPRHLFHFSPESLRRVMSSVGFKEVRLATNTTYVERSAGYVLSEALGRAGFTMAPASEIRPRGVPSRAARKLLRLALVRPFGLAASLCGAGASIEAVFARSESPVDKD